MEFEALLLGLEPLTALAIGVSAIVAVPVVNAVSDALGKDTKLTDSLSESAKELTKKALVFGMETIGSAQGAFAEAEESFRDLVADAKAEQLARKANETAVSQEPRQVEIASE